MTKQSMNKLPKGAGRLPWGARTIHHCRTEAVDFLKNEGGPFGVKLTLDLANVKKLRSALKTCMDAAIEVGRGKVEIDARWGKRATEKGKKGFRLDVKVA